MKELLTLLKECFMNQQQKLLKMLHKKTWVSPANFSSGWRFSSYIQRLKRKGYLFEEMWVDTDTKKRHYKKFKLVGEPKKN